MTAIACPSCLKPLVLRLLPDHDSSTWCRRCRRAIDPDNLFKSGIPSELLMRLKRWEKGSPKITGIGIDSGYGEDLDDDSFVRAWRAMREETNLLLADFRKYLETDADVVAEVFDLRPRDTWTDHEILRWRHEQQRLRLSFEYGCVSGRYYRGSGGTPPGGTDRLPIPFPACLQSDQEREAFRSGFCLMSNIGAGLGEESWRSKVAELERRLGIGPTKKPSGELGPPDGCRDEGEVRGR